MRNYIYKIIIAVIALIIVFEFTIGKTLNKITSQTDSFFTREGRKEMVGSIKDEMQKAIKKENTRPFKIPENISKYLTCEYLPGKL